MDKVAREDEKKEWYFSSVIATYWLALRHEAWASVLLTAM
jgi:hypothetical protein